MRKARFLPALALLLATGSAVAHPGHEAASFFSGFAHPLGGADHFLAMLAVGLLAAPQIGPARWALPAAFLLSMLGGAALAWVGLRLPGAELGVAASLLALGLLVGTLVRLSLGASLPLMAACALCHGYAHGAESSSDSLAGYAAGFMVASGLLYGAGCALALWLPQRPWAIALRRVAGATIAGAGLVLFAG